MVWRMVKSGAFLNKKITKPFFSKPPDCIMREVQLRRKVSNVGATGVRPQHSTEPLFSEQLLGLQTLSAKFSGTQRLWICSIHEPIRQKLNLFSSAGS